MNDSIPNYLFKNIKKSIKNKSRILLLGLSFKEDVGDIRNSKSIELAKKIQRGKFTLDCYDPNINPKELSKEYNITVDKPKGKYDCIIVAVSHKEFIKMRRNNILKLLNSNALILDVKGIWRKELASSNCKYWCL